MVNFRYHIVSLVAVFLALTLGIIVGTTVIDQQIVAGLRAQRDRDAAAIRALEEQSDAHRLELDLWDRFGEATVPPMMRGALRGATVVFLIEEGAPEAVVRAAGDAVVAAGGSRGGRITFLSKWALDEATERERLALAIGESATADAASLLAAAATRLAARLQAARDPTASGDLVDGLVRAGLVALSDLPDGGFPAKNAILVWVGAGAVEARPDHAAFTLPLLRALGGDVPVGVVEPLTVETSLVERIRGDQGVRSEVVTVDHVQTWPGRFALVVGLRDLAAGRPAEHYGVRRGAEGLAPDVG